jgi:ParB family chromosome partitioning protein
MSRELATGQKKRKKMALGRGLDALIPDIDAGQRRPQDYFECDPDLIRSNRYQPRKHFPREELDELAESIRSQGIIQPLLVRKTDDGYELVAGERRLRAARVAGLKTVPVVVKSLTDAEMLEMSIVENIQRENLNPMEEAEAYHRLITEFDLTQDQAAARVGKSRSAVTNFLRLRHLPPPVKDSIVEGRLSMGHARALLGTDSTARQLDIWRTVTAKGLSVRQTEQLVRRAKSADAGLPKPGPSSEGIFYADIAADLSRYYGTKVDIRQKGKKGKVVIEFYSDADLDRLLQLLKK